MEIPRTTLKHFLIEACIKRDLEDLSFDEVGARDSVEVDHVIHFKRALRARRLAGHAKRPAPQHARRPPLKKATGAG